MVNPLGGSRLKEPMVFRLQFPVRHNFKTYSKLTFHRRANIDDIQIGSQFEDPRQTAIVVLARLAKVPKAVIGKMHDTDLVDLVNGVDKLLKLDLDGLEGLIERVTAHRPTGGAK